MRCFVELFLQQVWPEGWCQWVQSLVYNDNAKWFYRDICNDRSHPHWRTSPKLRSCTRDMWRRHLYQAILVGVGFICWAFMLVLHRTRWNMRPIVITLQYEFHETVRSLRVPGALRSRPWKLILGSRKGVASRTSHVKDMSPSTSRSWKKHVEITWPQTQTQKIPKPLRIAQVGVGGDVTEAAFRRF